MHKQIVTLGVLTGALLLGQAAPTLAQAPAPVYNPYTGTWVYPPPPPNPYIVSGPAPVAVQNNYTGATSYAGAAAGASAASYNHYTGVGASTAS